MKEQKLKKRVLKDFLSLSDEDFEQEVYLTFMASDNEAMKQLQKKYKKEIKSIAEKIDPTKIIRRAEKMLKGVKKKKTYQPV